jgi:hypothetical protein
MADSSHPDDDVRRLEDQATRLDTLGDYLIEQAGKVGGVASLSAAIQREAIELAKEILDKLKVRFGEVNILSGLHCNEDDDVTAMGDMEEVLTTYDHLLAYAASMDTDILSHPAVMSATQAFGQVGYLCKEEAKRLAISARNNKMADRIAAQLSRIQNQFSGLQDKRFSALTERIGRGITTIISRIQTIAGPSALVGHSIEQNISSFMTSTPTAGQARQSLASGQQQDQAKKTVQMQQAEEIAARAQAQRIMQQNAFQQSLKGNAQNTPQPAASGRSGRQQLQQARSTAAMQRPAQNPQVAAKPATPAPTPSAAQPPKPPALSAAEIAMKIDPRIIMGFQTATSTSGIKTGAVGPRTAKDTIQNSLQSKPQTPVSAAPPLMPGTTAKGSMAPPVKSDAEKAEEQRKKKQIDEQMLQPPPPPPSKGGGRGY